MEHLRSLENSNLTDEQKAKIINEISESFDTFLSSEGNGNILEVLNVFVNYLKNGDYQFFSESSTQKTRKTILEMIHRLPMSESIRPHVNSVLALMLMLIREDNEENVLICLRIIIDIHKQYRPTFYPQIKEFLLYIQNIYSNFPNHMDKIFDPRYERMDPSNFNIDDIYTLTDKIIPRGRNSFKVLQELPIVLVLLYQLYKQNIHDHVVLFLPVILNTITLEPKKEYRAMENFNKELFVDFMGAQIKTLAFLAYTIKTFPGGLMEIIEAHAAILVEGMILLLRLCPKEVAHLRKELLVAIRHILATNLRNHFIPSIELLFDEDLLLGRGHTSLESLRPLAYSTLGDFIHHVRLELNFEILSKAIHLFSKNIHDETLPIAIQIMSIRLLLNLVECIRIYRHGNDLTTTSANRKQMLQNMLKVFVLKFHTIANIQIPVITKKWKAFLAQQSANSTSTDTPIKEFTSVEIIPEAVSKLTSIGFTPSMTITISEYRLLVKSLVGGIKQIIFGINYIDSSAPQQQVLITLSTQEVQQFIDFFNWALEAFYIYRINAPVSSSNQKATAPPAVQREEKELLELFSGLFLNLSSQNFQEIFTTTITLLIEKMVDNQNLQIIINTFLSYRQTSPLFATVMVEFLLERMDVIGSADVEKSNLYLKLFKLIFGSVSMFATENETMIRPYLQKIVINSMEMAMRAEEPYNYFLLLRALFRSIGGGTYDILYQEFLPLLPALLGGLNRLQSGCHKQTMKDLFVELCLTVPVRLSSLLPFLKELMDPLVSALNGSSMLVTQGLRTLELCVDNLLPDFFCDHIQPVRAELMQSLWKTLRNQDNSSMGAFRILGKFGGGNRNMLVEAQKIEYVDAEHNSAQLQVSQLIKFPAKHIIDSAYAQLKNSNDLFVLKESWNVIKCYLISTVELNDERQNLQNHLNQQGFLYNDIIENNQVIYVENVVLKTALSAMFLAASKKELDKDAHPFAIFIVNQFTIAAISNQFTQQNANLSCNPCYILDGVLSIMESEEKEVCAFGNSILLTIIKLASCIVGSRDRVCKLTLINFMFERILRLFYERSTFAKKGGCIALRFLCDEMPNSWISKHAFSIVKSHIFVIRDLADDVCSGTIDVAIQNIEVINEKTIPCLCAENATEEMQKIYKSAVNEFVYHTASSHKLVREISVKSLQQISKIQNTTVTALLEPYKNFFSESIVFSPAKTYLRHQPLAVQIGILEANYFCTSLEPKLMKFDNYQFLTDVKIIIKCDDDTMCRYDAYKDIKLLPELREKAMKVLVSWHYIYHKQHYDTDKVKNINFCDEAFVTLFKSLESHQSLQETAFKCLKKLINECKEKTDSGCWPIQHSFLEALGEYSTWTTNSIKRLSYYCLLFPKMFTEKTCEQLFEIAKKLLRGSMTANQDQNYLKIARTGEVELKIAAIINLFHIIPACSAKFVILLIKLVLAAEDEIGLESSCPYREPLVKFLMRYPDETIAFLLNDECMKNIQLNRFMIFLINHKESASFKTVIESKGVRLKELILMEKASSFRISNQQVVVAASGLKEDYEVRRQAVLIVHTIISFNDQWLPSQMGIVNALNQIWTTFLYKNALEQNITCDFWHLVTKILLHYFEHNPGDVELLFQLLRIYNTRFVPDFQFLRDFIYKICQNYTVDWKRNAFFLFVDYYNRPNVPIDLKIKILSMIIIPSFAVSFEKGEENRLIKGVGQDEESNIISIFINKIVNPFMQKVNDDGLRIVLLQFACLLVERASAHIQSNRKEDIRQLTTFGYSSLLHSKNYWDPSAVYNGHLLLSHIIAKLANKKSWQEVVFKVFHSLLKAHAIEARHIVRQTLEVFMPMMPLKMNESNLSLINLTKSVIVKDGYAILQLYHVFQVIIRHHTIYYPVRHQLLQNMIHSMQRLESSNSVDYRKLAIDIAEVIINWELRRIKETGEIEAEEKLSESGAMKRSLQDMLQISIKKQAMGEHSPSSSSVQNEDISNRPIDYVHCKAVINFLFDLLFMLSEQSTTQMTTVVSPNEVISKHSINLLKKVLKKDVWIKEDNDLQLVRLKKVFEEPSKVSSATICNFLEIFIHLLDELAKSKILSIIRALQPGLAICITSAQTKVLRLMSTFLTKLISLFPVEVYMAHDELRFLYQTVEKAIRNGLEVFEKDGETPTASFFGTFLILKTAFSNDSKYFEKFVEKFTKFVILLKNEHLATNPQPPSTSVQSMTTPNVELTKEMLMQSLHLLKKYISVMAFETRKNYINVVLVELIEKSNDPRVLRAIIQLLDNWFKMKSFENEPSNREKVLLIQKLTYHVENRFASESALNIQFLDLIYFIYSDSDLNTMELTANLDRAFLAGLRSSQHDIRQKFYKLFDDSVSRNFYDRLLYILSTKAWDSIGHHYWIKQCVELLFQSIDPNTISDMTPRDQKLLSITNGHNVEDIKPFTRFNTDALDIIALSKEYETGDRESSIEKIAFIQSKYLNELRDMKADDFIRAIVQICHADSELTEKLWIKTFPQFWSIFRYDQRESLRKEIIPFLAAGTKINIKEANTSALNTFIQALTFCEPPLVIPHKLMKSLSKVHNIWHRMALVGEEMVEAYSNQVQEQSEFEFDEDDDDEVDNEEDTNSTILSEIVGSLSDMYSAMKEEDLWIGLWQSNAKYPETNTAMFYEQMGYFEDAQSTYESVMSKFKQDVTNGLNTSKISAEIQLWEDQWIRCSKELNEWNIILSYTLTNRDKYGLLTTDCAWKAGDWNLMKQSLLRTEQVLSKQFNARVSLYGGYVSLLTQRDNAAAIGKYIELASNASLQEWRNLPQIVSNIHIPILQMAQQIMELQEAGQIHQDLLRKHSLPFHDMKSIIKTWRNRLPIISDDLSYWRDIFTWRQYHYKMIADSATGNNTIVANLGSQASAQTFIKLGKIARKHNLINLSQKTLQEMESVNSVPVIDCFQRILQQIKCFIQIAQYSEDPQSCLADGLKITDNVNLELFQPESKAVLWAYKGYLHTYLGNSTEANKAFSLAVDLCDNSSKAWALYGEYLETAFTKNSKNLVNSGVSALTCFLHASRENNEVKTRKYLSKVLYLLTYDEARVEMLKAFENYMLGVPMINWLVWIPQLFNGLVQYESDTLMNLLNQIAKIYPQAIYFPIRTLYLMLKIEQRERYKSMEQLKSQHSDQPSTSSLNQSSLLSMKSTSAMFRCSKIMQLVREIHPTIVYSLENILDQMMSKSDVDGVRWFRENIFEENLHQLKQALTKCYALAFENRTTINVATTTPHTLNFVRKLIANFTLVSENVTESMLQDPVFFKLKQQFMEGFNFTQPDQNKLLDLIERLKACIVILTEKVKHLPRSFVIEEKYRFLSNFTQKTAEIDLPGELLVPNHSHYHIKIARFMPRVEIVQKHNTSARRLYIQGTNGKIYPYLIVNDSGLADARREERILQLMRMLNAPLQKFKETSKRFISMTVPRVVAVFPQMRLVEDVPSSLSLLDIFKKHCTKNGIDHNKPISHYYEQLSQIQKRGHQANHLILKDIFKDIQKNFIPKTVLKDWACQTFDSSTDFWTFRKMFTAQLALWSTIEYALYLTRLNPEMLYVHKDTGLANVSYFKFEIDDMAIATEASASRIPFRLTPNICELIGNIGISGPFMCTITAIARCFLQPNYHIQSITRTILRDEILSNYRKQMMNAKPIDLSDDLAQDKSYLDINSDYIVENVERALSLVRKRLDEITTFNPNEPTKLTQLIQKSQNYDYLAYLDPTWYPEF